MPVMGDLWPWIWKANLIFETEYHTTWFFHKKSKHTKSTALLVHPKTQSAADWCILWRNTWNATDETCYCSIPHLNCCHHVLRRIFSCHRSVFITRISDLIQGCMLLQHTLLKCYLPFQKLPSFLWYYFLLTGIMYFP